MPPPVSQKLSALVGQSESHIAVYGTLNIVLFVLYLQKCGNCPTETQSKCLKILQKYVDLLSDKSPVQPCKRDRTSGRTITLPVATCDFVSSVFLCAVENREPMKNHSKIETIQPYLNVCIFKRTYISHLIHKELKSCICQIDPNR